MPVQNVIINSADVPRSVDFYTAFLDGELTGESTAERAVIDFVTATIEVRRAREGQSRWVTDDQQRGFRHVGFKVDRLDQRAATLRAANVEFHLDPMDAEGQVRICFFFDPDGTLLEFVEGDLQYTSVLDPAGVDAERALGAPGRPRFDHVAVTVADRALTQAFYRDLGFSFIGTIEQPHDPRGFSIGYLKSGDTVLEIFTYQAGTTERSPQLNAPGFAYARLSEAGRASTGRSGTASSGLTRVGTVDGEEVVADRDGFTFVALPSVVPA